MSTSHSQYHTALSIGLFGFGVVGEGLYKVLQQTPSLNAFIKKFVLKTQIKAVVRLPNFLQPTEIPCLMTKV